MASLFAAKKKQLPAIRDRKGYHSFREIKRDAPFFLMLVIPIAYFLIFKYWPLFGLSMAFQDYKIGDPFISSSSKWVGLKWFIKLFKNPFCWRWIRNTLLISLYDLIFNFPMGIILALMFNELRHQKVKDFVSDVSLLPHFISTVVIVGMLYNLFSTDGGVVNNILTALGYDTIDFLGSQSWFRTLYTGSAIWQNAGFNAIVFTAAIAGIDTSLYEAAKVDGATRFQCVFRITIPCIIPTIVTMFLLRIGNFMSVGYEKIILMYSPAIYEVSDTLSTYSYRAGVLDGKTSLSTAVGLFNAICNIILIVTANRITKKLSNESLW